MKIVISGGHLTPALSVIDYIIDNNLEDEVVFFGRLFSQANNAQKAVEKAEVEKRNIRFIPFTAPRLVNSSIIKKIQSGFKLGLSIIKALNLLHKEKPDVFLSFGGYLAVPFAIASRIKGIPVITHEQTRGVGLSNKMIAKFATSIAVSFEDSIKYFPQNKVVLTGNPVRKSIFSERLLIKKNQDSQKNKDDKNNQSQSSKFLKPSWVSIENTKPLLLVMGGNQGSLVINNVIKDSLAHLLPNWMVVHQCGRATKDHDYKNELLGALDSLVENNHLEKIHQASYIPLEWIGEDELFWLYKNASLAVSRSGINSVQELAIVSLPAIFIPLPFAYMDEQRVNAQWLSDVNGAIIIDQNDLTSKNLLQEISRLKPLLGEMKNNLKNIKIERNADRNLYNLIKEISKK